MHLSEPERAIAEMVRVVRPGGIVAVAEPTNVCGPVVDSIAMGDAPAVTAELLNLLLTCQLGATHLGLGSQLIGESMPALFRAAGLLDVEVRQCDRTWTLVPPYESEFEQAQVQDARDALTARRWVWDEKTAKTYFIAGGGDEAAFDAKWTLAMSQLERVVEAIEAGRFSRAGGGLSYWSLADGVEGGG
jgi:SAM-dependent methyltransferase